MDLTRGAPLSVIYFVPQPNGILPPLRGLGLPQHSGQPFGNPLSLLAQASQTAPYPALQYPGGGPSGSAVDGPGHLPPDYDDNEALSDDLSHDFMECLHDHITEVLDWYQSTVTAVGDVDGLARQVRRFIDAACKHYAEQGTVPAMRDVQMSMFYRPLQK